MAGRQRRVAGRADSVLAELPARWRAWGSTSTGAARPDGGSTRARVSTCCRPTGGSPASITCPGAARPGRGPDGRRRGVLAGAAADRLAPRRSGRGDRHLQHLRLRRAQDAAEGHARGGPVPRRPARGEDDRGRAQAGRARQVRAAGPVRRPSVLGQAAAWRERGGRARRAVRQDHRDTGTRRRGPGRRALRSHRPPDGDRPGRWSPKPVLAAAGRRASQARSLSQSLSQFLSHSFTPGRRCSLANADRTSAQVTYASGPVPDAASQSSKADL